MKSSFVASVMNFIKMLVGFFEYSIFNKIQNGTKTLWQKVTKNSFIRFWFSSYPVISDYWSNSLLCRVISFIFDKVFKLIRGIVRYINKSALVVYLSKWYSEFLTNSIRVYGLSILGYALSYLILVLIRQSYTMTTLVGGLCLICCSLICIVVNRSLTSLFSNSKLFKFFFKLFDCPVIESVITHSCSHSTQYGHFIFGILLGVLEAFSNGIPVIVLLVGILLFGTVFYNYKLCLFSTIVLFPILPTLVVLGLVAFCFAVFVLNAICDKSFKFKRTPLDIPLALFVLVSIISTITSPELIGSLKVLLVYFTFICGYYMVVNSISSKEQFNSLLTGVFYCGLIVALYGISQYFFGFEEGRIWTDNNMFDIKTRVVSTFENPNVLGEYLLLLIPIGIAYILSRKGAVLKVSDMIVTGCLCLCMVYTYSRGNWLGLIFAVIAFFMFYNGKYVWFGLLFALFIPLFLPDTIINRFTSIGDVSDTSTSYRVLIWMGTFRMLSDYWLTGVGLGNAAFSNIYQHYSYNAVPTQHSHNLYLQIISESGILGLLLVVAIIFIYYRMSISTVIKLTDKKEKGILLALSAGMFGFLIQGLFDYVWYNWRIVFMFFLMLALTSCYIMFVREHKEVEGIRK